MKSFLSSGRRAVPACKAQSPGRSSCRSTSQPCRSARQAKSQQAADRLQLRQAAEPRDVAFVDSFRRASSYVHGHRQTTVIVVLPLEVMTADELLSAVVQDLVLLQGMGVRLVIAVEGMQDLGVSKTTDLMQAMQATAFAQMELQRRLAQGLSLKVVRRHTRTYDSTHSSPAIHSVTGNWVLARPQGIIDGKDMSACGQVRFIEAEHIQHQLAAGNVVILSSIGFSTAGQALPCDVYSVATAAAAALQADKLICTLAPGMLPFQLPSWISDRDMSSLLNTLALEPQPGSGTLPRLAARPTASMNPRLWQQCGLPRPLIATCAACAQGVKRAHLVDASVDGALLMEMYSDANSAGTMVSHDFHEGMRAATLEDLAAIKVLMQPLEAQGVLLPRSDRQLLADLPCFCVMESRHNEGQVVGCAMIKPLAQARDGHMLGELGAFCTLPTCQGSGMGDSFLEWLEHEAQGRGLTRLVLLTTRTGSWFADRGYSCAGLAHATRLLPTARRLQINMERNSMLYYKDLNEHGLPESQKTNEGQKILYQACDALELRQGLGLELTAKYTV